jgi:hypothetical protein
LLRRTLAARFGETKTDLHIFRNLADRFKSRQLKNFQATGNKRASGTVLDVAASVAFKTGFKG